MTKLGQYFSRGAMAALAAITLSLPACDRSQTGEQSTATSGADPIAGAPHEWKPFLDWAADKLHAQPPKVPIKVEQTATPIWDITRLDDSELLKQAAVSCNWKPAGNTAPALAEIGPFSSDQPSPPVFAVERLAQSPAAGGAAAVTMRMAGFEVTCEDVGAVELKLSVPFGNYVTLAWAISGQILIPVESHSEPFTVRVSTDGFAEWSGKLSQIMVSTDGIAAGVVTIHKLRFLPHEDSYPKSVDLKRVRLGHEIRSAIAAHCPSRISFQNIKMPPHAQLHFGFGAVGDGADGGAATFDVEIACGGRSSTVFSERIGYDDEWRDAAVSLSEWAGQTATISLSVSAPDARAVAFWANPIIYEPADNPPLVILYLIDTVSAEHLNLYARTRPTTPRLAQAAAQGVLFEQMFSNSSRTIESVADMMLSMPTERHGVRHSSIAAPLQLVTLADSLRAAGMATVSFCTNVNAGPRQGMDQGFDTFVDKISYFWANEDRTVPIDEVMAWLAQHHDRPAFVYIHTAEPHAPYTPPEGFAGRFDSKYTGKIDGSYDPRTGFHAIRNPRKRIRDMQHVIALYDEEILYSDARFGEFLDRLREAGFLQRTQFFVTSDHGEEFLQHWRWEHGTDLHNEQTRVPLIAFGPSFRAGVRVRLPVQIFDIMPTILAMFDLQHPYQLAGDSLLPFISKSATPAERRAARQALQGRDIFASNHAYRISNDFIEYSMIDGGRWKVVLSYMPIPDSPIQGRFQLFDLQVDQHERANLIGKKQDIARGLIEKLVRWRVRQSEYDSGQRGPTEVDKRQIDQLIGLGYVAGPEDAEPNQH